MKEYQSLSHTRWDYKYHVVFNPEEAQKEDIRGTATASWGDISRACGAEESKIRHYRV
jgi:putative transposase